nr:MAG TPA: hypothetical protein [Caudoviricetes sp.]
MKFAKQIQIGSRKVDRFGSTSIPTKKNIHGNTEKVGQLAQHCKIGFTLSTFPHSDGRLRYTHFLSKLILRQSSRLTLFFQFNSKHRTTPFPYDNNKEL